MLADLHTHTTASDGMLTPAELIAQARSAGVTHLSITDHDTTRAYETLSSTTDDSLTLIPGIEFSSRWQKTGIHIVGLNIDPDDAGLQAAIKTQGIARKKRAETIAEKLTKLGFKNTLEGARNMAGDSIIGRPHFARYLVESGQVKSFTVAFKKYLGSGKPGDVKDIWPTLDTVIDWIHTAGGTAVLAHPAKYKLSNMKLEALAHDFQAAGGRGLEVISGQQDAALTLRLGKLANRLGMVASCGSDFHQPGQSWAELGRVQSLPDSCTPVWESW
jgi:predicted metal-dependent phosphoesterase TrpH